jgi:hypothetical protein
MGQPAAVFRLVATTTLAACLAHRSPVMNGERTMSRDVATRAKSKSLSYRS